MLPASALGIASAAAVGNFLLGDRLVFGEPHRAGVAVACQGDERVASYRSGLVPRSSRSSSGSGAALSIPISRSRARRARSGRPTTQR